MIKKILNTFYKKQIINPLGRWNIDYCMKKMNRKVDLSNEDHCGPCGEYRIIANTETSLHKKTKQNFTQIVNNPVFEKPPK